MTFGPFLSDANALALGIGIDSSTFTKTSTAIAPNLLGVASGVAVTQAISPNVSNVVPIAAFVDVDVAGQGHFYTNTGFDTSVTGFNDFWYHGVGRQEALQNLEIGFGSFDLSPIA